MKLRRLSINRLPGIDTPFEFDAEGTGFHVVYGPNGIGKSSICRAVEALLWAEHGAKRRVSLTGRFELNGECWQCEREDGEVRWQRNGSDSPRPGLPAPHFSHCFFLRLRDLINPEVDTKDIATEIKRQMSGGFNLPRVVSDRFNSAKPRAAEKAVNNFRLKSKELSTARNKQNSLRNEADKVVGLETELKRAQDNQDRLSHVKTAMAIVERRNKLNDLHRRISALPKNLDKLIGDEQERVERHRATLKGLNQRGITLAQKLEEAKCEKDESALKTPIEPTELATWRTRSSGLSRIELELKNLEKEYGGACNKLRAALDAVGGGDVKEAELDVKVHAQVFDFLRTAQNHEAKTRAIEERISLLERIPKFTDEDRKTLDKCSDGVNSLRLWLRTSDTDSMKKTATVRRYWFIGAGLLIVGGGAMAVAVHPALALVAGLGGGLVLALLMWRPSRSSQFAKADFEKLGLDLPEKWDRPSVEACLHDLEGRVAEFEARKVRSRDRNIETESLKNDLECLSDRQKEIETRRQSLQKSLNLNEIRGDAELVDLARALDQLRQARIDQQNMAGKVKTCKKQYNSLLYDLGEALENYGQTKADDAAAAIAGIDLLATRNSQLRAALSNEKSLSGEIERVNNEVAEVGDDIKKIFSGLDLDPDDSSGLATLVGLRPDFEKLGKECAKLKIANDLDCARLSDAGEEALADKDQTELDELESRLSNSARSAAELRNQIAEINASVKNAKEAHDIESLIGERDAALACLEGHFDNELFERVGKLLIHGVEREHEKNQIPRVLRRTRNLFSTFTHHSYDIRLGTEVKDTRLIAIETRTRNEMELAELSDGTRVQLLLAARLAFAEEIERGNPLPLFLDEALDQSDPARYREMVKSLGRIAENQDRQIFYFTTDKADLNRIQDALAEDGWAKARSTDLGLVRNQAESIADPLDLSTDPIPSTPDPADQTAEEYAIAIGVPTLDPRRGANDQHLFYLLRDDLDLLHALLENGIKSVGQWRGFSGSDLAAKLRDEFPSLIELEPKTDLFAEFCDLCNQGHGRPVDHYAIEESGAISGRFLSDVVTIADEKNGDGKRLIEALKTRDDPRLKTFHGKNTDKLESYLREAGYIDDRPMLNEGDILSLSMASPAAAQLPARVPRQYVVQWLTMAARASCK